MCFIFDCQSITVVQEGDFVRQFYQASHITQLSAFLAGTVSYSLLNFDYFVTVLNGGL
jgi:hypothetical protein